MNKKNILMLSCVVIFGFSIFKITTASESKVDIVSPEGIKSLAYYVANIQEARTMNQTCYDKGLDMKSTPDCANSLQALQMSHVGGERSNGYKFSSR